MTYDRIFADFHHQMMEEYKHLKEGYGTEY
jgi:hypothetical protein